MLCVTDVLLKYIIYGVWVGRDDASHHPCLHTDSLSFDGAIVVLNVIMSVIAFCNVVFLLEPFHCTTLVLSCCEMLF